MSTTALIVPSRERLPAYVEALERGWSPDNLRGAEATREILERIHADAALFVERQTDVEARGGPVTLPDGSTVARIPGRTFWIVDGDETAPAFCGSINLRWQHGTTDLPPHCLGHVGYAVVPWKRRQGHASAALRALLPYARALGLPWIAVTTDPDNVGSRKVIEAAGGVLVETMQRPAAYGHSAAVRYRIDLGTPS
jgi:predicted acetyltransferase